MKKYSRLIFGFLIVSPFMVAIKFISLFVGEEKAIKLIGPHATMTAKQMLRFWVPRIDSSKNFDEFSIKMKKNLWLWRSILQPHVQKNKKMNINVESKYVGPWKRTLSNLEHGDIDIMCGLYITEEKKICRVH